MTRQNKTLSLLLLLLAIMIGLTAYSSTLYSMFCDLTGYDGTTGVAATLPDYQTEQTITVRFDADTAPNMPWEFRSETKPFKLRLGAPGHAKFYVKNTSDKPINGIATYNVTPTEAGLFFQKVQCFCFEKHTLQPGEVKEFPVLFFIDPSIANNPGTKDLKEIALHYTYFEAKD